MKTGVIIIKSITKTRTELMTYLAEEEYRIGQTRRALINMLDEIKHYSAEKIIEELKKTQGKINVTTVYNNLNFLVEQGEKKKNRFNNRPLVHYEANVDLHAHLICLDSESIVDIDHADLKKIKIETEMKHGFEIFDVTFDIYGRCKNCRK
jgi:Fur family peroxide stress response transcriptional regulator